MRAVVTVVGKDCPGIIAKVSGLLFENNINTLDIFQKYLWIIHCICLKKMV